MMPRGRGELYSINHRSRYPFQDTEISPTDPQSNSGTAAPSSANRGAPVTVNPAKNSHALRLDGSAFTSPRRALPRRTEDPLLGNAVPHTQITGSGISVGPATPPAPAITGTGKLAKGPLENSCAVSVRARDTSVHRAIHERWTC